VEHLTQHLTALVLLAAGFSGPAQLPDSIGVVRIVPPAAASGHGERVYEITAGACRIRWTVARSGVNEGVAQHRAECSRPLSEQIGLNSRILDTVLAGEPAFRTLFLGGLKAFPELSLRMALAAKRSPGWDVVRGRPKASRQIDAYVLNMLAAAETTVFPEWKQLFERKDLRFAVSGVEGVSVGTAGALPYFQELSTHGVKSTDRVPFDGLIWFSVKSRK
jgi:hypothetical protein